MLYDMENRIKNVLKQKVKFRIDINEIKPDDNLLLLGMDSLSTLKLVVDIENEFKILFGDDDFIIDNFKTINKLKEIIEKKLDKKENYE